MIRRELLRMQRMKHVRHDSVVRFYVFDRSASDTRIIRGNLLFLERYINIMQKQVQYIFFVFSLLYVV